MSSYLFLEDVNILLDITNNQTDQSIIFRIRFQAFSSPLITTPPPLLGKIPKDKRSQPSECKKGQLQYTISIRQFKTDISHWISNKANILSVQGTGGRGEGTFSGNTTLKIQYYLKSTFPDVYCLPAQSFSIFRVADGVDNRI